MIHSVVTDDDEFMDWANLFDNIPDDCKFDFLDDSGSVNSLCPSVSIDEIEYLLNDDSVFSEQEGNPNYFKADEFFSDVLADSPLLGSDQSAVIRGEDEQKGNDDSSHDKVDVQTEENNCDNVGVGSDVLADSPLFGSDQSAAIGGEDEEKGQDDSSHEKVVVLTGDDVGVGSDDTVDKKRKRQMRNRDAAVRSRERKKLHLRDLESKSRYYEAECKRLGALLQCCLSENQALRLSLYKGVDGSAANKQESAVLLLESLLLGSLLGLLGIIVYLVILSHLGREELGESVSSRKTKMEEEVRRVLMMMGKQYKASRSRMRVRLLVPLPPVLCLKSSSLILASA